MGVAPPLGLALPMLAPSKPDSTYDSGAWQTEDKKQAVMRSPVLVNIWTRPSGQRYVLKNFWAYLIEMQGCKDYFCTFNSQFWAFFTKAWPKALQTDVQIDGRTHPLVEMQGRCFYVIHSFYTIQIISALEILNFGHFSRKHDRMGEGQPTEEMKSHCELCKFLTVYHY